MRAINLFAGTGTLTRAFSDQGAKIIWAQEEEAAAAAVYQHNFPQIPFYNGILEEALTKVPEHDLLLASVRDVPELFYAAGAKKADRGVKAYRKEDREAEELQILRKFIERYRPSAVCLTLPARQREKAAEECKAVEMLKRENYFWTWKILSGTQHGQVPFEGKRIYLVGFRDQEVYSRFEFPETDRDFLTAAELLKLDEKKEERFYRIPRSYEALFQNQEVKTGNIYRVMPGRGWDYVTGSLKESGCCPVLTGNSWYKTFVKDQWGIRRITPEEYLLMQGDGCTRFPSEMSCRKIWEAMRSAGVYGIEKKLALRMRRAWKGVSLQEEIAGYLLQKFDREIYDRRKRVGMVCMPTGTGYTKTMEYLVRGVMGRTQGRSKVVVLETLRELCAQMQHRLQKSGFRIQTAAAPDDICSCLTGDGQILIVTYAAWAGFIRNCSLRGYHKGLVLLGAGAERGWRSLIETEKYFPQAIYAGIASVPDPGASEVFGPVLYQYTLQQAYKDRQLLPVSVDCLLPGNAHDDSSFLTESVWRDIIVHNMKTVIIADTILQANSFCRSFMRFCVNDQADWNIYLCISTQTSEDRMQQLYDFRDSPKSVLIMVGMWINLQSSAAAQFYVLGRHGEYELEKVLSLASRIHPEKEKSRVVFLDQELWEKARSLTGDRENCEELTDFCAHLWNQEYEEAEKMYRSVLQSWERLAEQLKEELGTLSASAFASKISQMDRKQRRLMLRLWLLMSESASCWEVSQSWKTKSNQTQADEETEETEMEEADQEVWKRSLPPARPGTFNNPAEKGAVLENVLLKLLGHLFIWNREDNPHLEEKTEAILQFLQKKPGGDQNGRDVDLIYLDETGQRRRCCLECKYIQSKKLTEEVILSKILQAQRSAREEIEHWILVAPNGRLNKHAAELFEDAERFPGKYAPIKNIQIWNEESQIFEFLGLEPELYEMFYGEQRAEEQNPRMWSAEKRNEIIRKWKRKLMPVMLLPAGLRFYPFQPEKIMFELQNDAAVRERYETLFKYRVKMSFYEENQRTPQACLEEEMIRWLQSDKCQARLLLGEYASGKTFFLYCLCRKLIDEFVKNPQRNYIPVCLSLKDLKDMGSPQTVIEKRMKELGCLGSDFYELKEHYHVLVCLDGFDEISSVIDERTVSKNLKLLAKCCEYLTGARILITSRPQCFEKNDVKRWLSDRVDGLEVLYLAPVEEEDGEQFVLFGTEEEERVRRWEQLAGNKNIRELMGKPFFLDMIRQLLESGEKIGENTVSIYERYIRKCLRRKFDNSFDREDVELLDTEETVTRIYDALCLMAYRLQKQGREVVQIREFEAYLGTSASKVLWMENNADENVRQDADNRFSMRTLLKHAGERAAAFSHRSIREYFTAVYLGRLLKEDSLKFKDELEKNYFSLEILGFFAELIQETPLEYKNNLSKLTGLVNQDSAKTDLSAKIMQTLYFAGKDRKIPRACWSDRDLSGISIPGADLSEQNFRGTRFVNANLNNVRLDHCDCSGCDMTGARLGESTKILSLRYEHQELVCLYEDGCLRRWDIRCLES